MTHRQHRTGEPIPREWYSVKPLPGCKQGTAEFGQDVSSDTDGHTLIVRALADVSRHNLPLVFSGWENCFVELQLALQILDFDGRVLAYHPAAGGVGTANSRTGDNANRPA